MIVVRKIWDMASKKKMVVSVRVEPRDMTSKREKRAV